MSNLWARLNDEEISELVSTVFVLSTVVRELSEIESNKDVIKATLKSIKEGEVNPSIEDFLAEVRNDTIQG